MRHDLVLSGAAVRLVLALCLSTPLWLALWAVVG
jgi:hypothetical protein